MKKKFKIIYSSFLKIIFDLIFFKLLVSDKFFFNQNVKIKKIKFLSNSDREYKIYTIKKSRIYSDGSENVAVIKKNFILPEISIQLSKNYLVETYKNSILKTGTRKFIQKKIYGNVLSLVQGVSAVDNYGHWLLDILPKLCIAEKYTNLNDFDAIYLPSFKKKFQLDSLKYFNINSDKYIDGSEFRHIYADKFTIPQHPYWKINKYQMDTVANIDPNIVNNLRDKFLTKDNNHEGLKLFIDRSDSKFFHSQIENIDEVCKLLKEDKFDILKLSNLSFEEQIHYFSNAKIIIGAHGAGLCNLIFCKPKTKIVEFSNKEFKCDVFKNISKINNLTYHKLVSISEVPANRIKPDIKVSVEELSKLIG